MDINSVIRHFNDTFNVNIEPILRNAERKVDECLRSLNVSDTQSPHNRDKALFLLMYTANDDRYVRDKQFYFILNNYIRSNQDDDVLNYVVNSICDLIKTTAVNLNNTVVTRLQDKPGPPGDAVVFNQFMSTSILDQDEAGRSITNTSILVTQRPRDLYLYKLTCKSKVTGYGILIGDCTNYTAEKEILFTPGCTVLLQASNTYEVSSLDDQAEAALGIEKVTLLQYGCQTITLFTGEIIYPFKDEPIAVRAATRGFTVPGSADYRYDNMVRSSELAFGWYGDGSLAGSFTTEVDQPTIEGHRMEQGFTTASAQPVMLIASFAQQGGGIRYIYKRKKSKKRKKYKKSKKRKLSRKRRTSKRRKKTRRRRR